MTNQLLPSNITLLIVDDSESDREIYSRYLQSDSEQTYRIIEAETLEEGLELRRSQQPDIVLLDLNLPDGDGLEFLEAINVDRSGESVPVIMLAAQGNEKMAVNAMKLGASDYLVKGDITAKSLTISVRQVLRETVLGQQLRRSQQQQILISVIALRIREFLNLEDISKAIVKEVRQFINADRAAIYKFNPDMSGTIVAEDIVSPWQPCLNVQVQDTCFRENLGGAYCEGKIFFANDIYDANLTACHIKLLERFQVRANLVVPILLPNANKHILWGLLILHQCSAPRIWEESDIQLLQRLSVKLSISIQQAIAYQQIQNELAERKRVEALLLEQQEELENRNDLLAKTYADLECTVEELRVAAEEQIAQHQRLEYEQHRYQNLFDFAPDGYLVTDLSGRISEVNQVILELLAISREFILGKPLVVFVASENRDFFYSQLNSQLPSTNAKTTWEITLRNHQGDLFPAEISVIQNINLGNNQPQLFWMIRNISDRKRAEQELLHLNQSLEAKVTERTQDIQLQSQMLEQIHDAVISTTLDGTIQTWNIGAERLYEYKSNEAIGQNITMLYLEKDLPIMNAEVFSPLMEKGNHEAELRNQTKSGTIIYIRLRLSVICDALGNPIRLIGCSNNISDRKQAENALRESQTLLQTVLNAFPLSVFWKDRQSVILGCNQLFAVTSGMNSPLEAIGKSDYDFACDEEEALTYIADDQQVMASGLAKLNIEEHITLASGEHQWLQTNKIPLRDAEGNVIGVMGTFQDISDRKEAELALAQKEQQFQELANASPSVIYSIVQALNGVPYFEYLSPACEKIHELTVAEAYQNSAIIFEQMYPDDLQGYGDAIEQSLKTLQPFSYEWRIITNSGTKWLRGDSLPSRRKNGDVVWHGVVTDISDHKQAELQLQKTTDRLSLALKSGAIGCWELNLANYAISWDERAYELHGIPFGTDVTSDTWTSSVHPDDLQSTQASVEQAIAGQREFDVEYRVIHPDRSIHFIKGYGVVERDIDGNALKMTGVNFDISASKLTEKALKQQLATIEAAIDGIAILQDNKYIYLNQSHLEIFRYERPDELLGKSWTDLYSSEEMTRFEQEVSPVLQRDRSWQGDAVATRKDGSTFDEGLSLTITEDGLLICVCRDISDRKLTETKLQKASERLTLALSSGAIGCWEWDIQQNIIHWDEKMYKLYGTGKTNEFHIVYEIWATAIHPEDRNATETLLQQAVLGQAEYDCEFRIVHPDRSIHFIKAYGKVKRDTQGNAESMIGVNFDISDRKQAEISLQNSEDRFRRIFDSSVVGMIFVDFQGHIIDANDRFLEMVGYTREDFQSGAINWLAMTPPEYLEKDYACMEILLKHRQIDPWEKEYYRKDGSRVSIMIGAALLQEENTEAICVILDISDRKQAEMQLQKVNQELLRTTKLKDEFLANMSHELRTPLNSILGLSESLQEQILGSMNARQLKAIATVGSSGEHLLSLINDILDLSKISSGMMELNIESVSVQNICESSLAFVKQQAFQKRIQINRNIPPRIHNINIDERRIKQVLINLLTNSVKFTPNGGNISLLVAIGSGDKWKGEATVCPQIKAMNSPMIVFQVVDTGIGIAPKDLRLLFQPFVQVDSTLNRQYEGTGLGLALVKQIVELHGGYVMVESEVGIGSRFTVILPYDHDISQFSTSSSAPNSAASPLVVNPESEIAPLILLAEDNEANIQTFSSYLTAVNYRVILARNGEEAVAMTKDFSPDIILMDIQMPKMDGLEAIGLIRADETIAKIPIIALTALAMESDRERCLNAGANAYLAKPVKLRTLNATIQQFL
ncbi:MAG: hypothetical protein DCF19_06755 [Pseudanabaena frigida]|uniref:Circadian input-output histidine kinase CikA n=1 Tax=Pseudanabaena frigida TaxID=945775 RepID=A0A2W4WCU7_9CYAN|nr:MAG: hypothetical protein DCF19_06755 [Pseudanabaena frigida]